MALRDDTVTVDVPLLAALARLTPDQREAWIDRHVLGDKWEDIAKRMGRSIEPVFRYEAQASTRLAGLLRLAA